LNDFAEKFTAYLTEIDDRRFQREDIADEHNSVIFRTNLAVQGQQIPLGILFDNTVYVIIRANMATHAVNDNNAYEVNHFITRMNCNSKLFKYYITPNTSIILDACIPMLPDEFSVKLIDTILQVVMKEVAAHHRELMQIIWQAEEK